MELKNQVITVDQARTLKKLGVRMDISLFVHMQVLDGVRQPMLRADGINYDFAAFTVAELGVMLPDKVTTRNGWSAAFRSGRICPLDGLSTGYTCGADYSNSMGIVDGYDAYRHWRSEQGNTEAQARAAMLIYLLESGMVKIEEVNFRLTGS